MATVGGHDAFDYWAKALDFQVAYVDAYGKYLVAQAQAHLTDAQAANQEIKNRILDDARKQVEIELFRLNQNRRDAEHTTTVAKNLVTKAAQLYRGAEGFSELGTFQIATQAMMNMMATGAVSVSAWEQLPGQMDGMDLKNLHHIASKTFNGTPIDSPAMSAAEAIGWLRMQGWCPRFGTKSYARLEVLFNLLADAGRKQYEAMAKQVAEMKFDPSVITSLMPAKAA